MQPRVKGLMHALVHIDALQPAAGLTGIKVGPVDDVLDRMWQIGIVAHVDRIAAAELETHTDEALRGDALHGARPPATDPVKATKSTRGSRMTRSVSACSRCSTVNTPAGRPAAAKHSAKRSPHSGVCAECFSTTALPASSAGTTLLTAIR